VPGCWHQDVGAMWVCSQSPGPCRQYSIANGRCWSVRVASVRVPTRPGGRGELRAQGAARTALAHRLLLTAAGAGEAGRGGACTASPAWVGA
jgi:hypothetical protein